MQVAEPDGVVAVTSPQKIAYGEVRKAINFAKQTEVPVIGVVENMAGMICPHCEKVIDVFGKGDGEKLAEEMSLPFLGSIPLSPEVSESGEKGKPMVEIGGKASEIYNELAEKILNQLEKEVTA